MLRLYRVPRRPPQRGLRVPEDVAALGYDGTLGTLMTDPPLSSVSTDSHRIVQRVGELLDQHATEGHHLIRPRLSVRGVTQ